MIKIIVEEKYDKGLAAMFPDSAHGLYAEIEVPDEADLEGAITAYFRALKVAGYSFERINEITKTLGYSY